MDGSDGRRKVFVDKRFAVYVLGIVLSITFVIAGSVVAASRMEPKRYLDCPDFTRKTGRVNVLSKDPLYEKRFDGDDNGIACQK